jgi:hypothetical protein
LNEQHYFMHIQPRFSKTKGEKKVAAQSIEIWVITVTPHQQSTRPDACIVAGGFSVHEFVMRSVTLNKKKFIKSWFLNDVSIKYEIYYFKKCISILWDGDKSFENHFWEWKFERQHFSFVIESRTQTHTNLQGKSRRTTQSLLLFLFYTPTHLKANIQQPSHESFSSSYCSQLSIFSFG